MADRIVWDFERFDEIHDQLWEASEMLEECSSSLQHISVNEAYTLRKNSPASRQIFDQFDALILRTARLGLQAETLCKAAGRVNYKIYGAEQGILSSIQELPTGDADELEEQQNRALFHIRPGLIPIIIPVIPIIPKPYIFIPAWLDEAIDIAFGRK